MEDIEIIRNNNDVKQLYTLIKILEKFFKGQARSVLEVTLLEEFPIDVIHPIEGFSPRGIIQNMMEKHRHVVQDIWENPKNLQTITIPYKTKKKTNIIKLTNNMEFYADIQIICFCYYKVINDHIQNELMQNIMEMMIHKYDINSTLQMRYSLTSTTITFYRIVYSFPSVTLDMQLHFNTDRCSFLNIPSINYKLPRAIFLPMIASIIPKLDDPPIALLTAIAIKISDALSSNKIPLSIIYRNIFMSYGSTIFPERLKLQLCRRWNIVTVMENEYCFNPFFLLYKEKSRKIILMDRSNDPDLNDILFRI